jgi:NAD-dependent dihydropyrimidine dehydrogenase PreA subunit
MTVPIYEKLTDALALRGGPAPALKCPEFYTLIEELFSPEEAELVIKMPLDLFTAEALANEIGADVEEIRKQLEKMADEGLLFTHDRGGTRMYTLMPLVPGIFEMQFTKGEVNERTKRLAQLFDDYFVYMRQAAQLKGPVRSIFPFARVIAVEKEIPADVQIHPYDKVSDYIARADQIAIAICYCRHHGELLGLPCDKPKDVCMAFGPQAKYLIERGFGKPISKEEAFQVLDRAEDAGLIHCSSNTGKYLTFICNCCDCHCGIIQSIKRASSPSMAANSSYIVKINEDDCTGCGSCLDRCQMDALSMAGSVAVRNQERCIGCGLCISTCPTEALRLELRKDAPVPPLDQLALNSSMISSFLQNKGT